MTGTWYPPANVPTEPVEYQPSAGTGGLLLLLPGTSTGGVLLQNPPWAGGEE